MGHLGHLSPVSSPPVKPNGHRPHIEPLSLNVKPQDNTKIILPVILLFCIKQATLYYCHLTQSVHSANIIITKRLHWLPLILYLPP